MSKYLEELVTEIFRAEGLEQPERAARLALAALVRIEVLPMAEVQRFEGDAKIYHLRGQGLGPAVLAARLGCSKVHIFRVTRRHLKHLRAVMRHAC